MELPQEYFEERFRMITRLEKMQMNSLGTGRIVVKDPRDFDYPLKAPRKPRGEKELTRRYWYQDGWKGNQQATPYCVGYGWVHWLEDGPITHKEDPPPMIDPKWLYDEAQKVDKFLGENYEGTTVRAGAKVLQQIGWIGEYRWTTDINVLVKTLLYTGPVVLGTWWFDSMYYPDKKGMIKLAGTASFGHCYVANGVNTKQRKIRIKNSWGEAWGVEGSAYIGFDEMALLLQWDGEACLATEISDKEHE